jgi:hypothetical protein
VSVVKQSERDVDHLPPSSAENELNCTSSPPVWPGKGQPYFFFFWPYLTLQNIGEFINMCCVRRILSSF